MTRWVVALCVVGLASVAAAADPAFDPKFEAGTKPPTDTKGKRIYKASAQAGLLSTTGNSNTLSFVASGIGSVEDGKNRGTLEAGGAYARTKDTVGVDTNGNGTISAAEEQTVSHDTIKLWNVRLRYDRILTLNNYVYGLAYVGGNEPTGKLLVAGAQIGYGRQIYHTDRHVVVGEAGVDYSYIHATNFDTVPDWHLFSLRLFLGYRLAFNKILSFMADIEYLGNLNPFDGVPGTYLAHVSSFQGSRVIGRVALNANLWKMLALRVGFTIKYDNAPSSRPAINLPYDPGYVPLASKIDTLTDVSLIVTFL